MLHDTKEVSHFLGFIIVNGVENRIVPLRRIAMSQIFRWRHFVSDPLLYLFRLGKTTLLGAVPQYDSIQRDSLVVVDPQKRQ